MKKNREFHDNKSENISGESIGGAALIRGRRLFTFLAQMRRLIESGAYSSRYGTCIIGPSTTESQKAIDIAQFGRGIPPMFDKKYSKVKQRFPF